MHPRTVEKTIERALRDYGTRKHMTLEKELAWRMADQVFVVASVSDKHQNGTRGNLCQKEALDFRKEFTYLLADMRS